MSVQSSLDAGGRRRSQATMPCSVPGSRRVTLSQRYPADPPTVDEIVAVMRQAGHDRHGHRLTALIVVRLSVTSPRAVPEHSRLASVTIS